MCDSYGNPIELNPEDVELISDEREVSSQKIDWDKVRVQAAIGAMQVIFSTKHHDTYTDIASQAVGCADALIKELKKQ